MNSRVSKMSHKRPELRFDFWGKCNTFTHTNASPIVNPVTKLPSFTASIAVFLAIFANTSFASNILSNPGFETGDLTGWTSFGPNTYVEGNEATPHGGADYLKMYGAFIGALNYTGVYQDTPCSPGVTYSADGWVYTLNTDNIKGKDAIWVEVSFRDALYNALALYRSAVVTSNNLARIAGTSTGWNVWFDLLITNQCSFNNPSAQVQTPGTVTNMVSSLVAPAGTAYVRYQVVFQQGSDNANGSMFYDDLTLNQTGGTVVTPPVTNQWNIVWSDEFNGNSINPNVWTFETGNGGSNPGWGNNELEYYTSRTNNVYEAGGLLHIVARKESYGGFNYTSARMKTQGLYSPPVYGRFEWRARLPAGTGMWPALWLLGNSIDSVGWPACGEIDVVENNGATPTWVQGSLHSNNGNPTAIYNFPNGGSVTNFHTYLLDWEPNSISYYVDGVQYESPSGGAPFNAPFFFIMNIAVGGNYVTTDTNAINAGTVFPQEMQVDYLRVYELTPLLQLSAIQTNSQIMLTWPTNIVCHLQAQTNSLVPGSWSDLPGATSPLMLPVDSNNSGVFYRLASP
jgi:beta-glucanase (GH16 family)